MPATAPLVENAESAIALQKQEEEEEEEIEEMIINENANNAPLLMMDDADKATLKEEPTVCRKHSRHGSDTVIRNAINALSGEANYYNSWTARLTKAAVIVFWFVVGWFWQLLCWIWVILLDPLRPFLPSFLSFQYLFPDIYWAANKEMVAWSNLDEVRSAVLESKSVKEAIGYIESSSIDRETGVVKHHRVLNKTRANEAINIFDNMAAYPRQWVLRMLSYVFRKTWRVLYVFGIHVKKEDLDKVRETVKRGHPLLLLPSHKSHVDYLICTYTCFAETLPMPFVVAGDNLNIPIVGRVLRWGGALFIRRSFAHDSDPLYATIFGEYLKQLLARGESIECFIEGGRSRSGKLLSPKIGVLHRVIDAILDKQVADVNVVPISLAYDKLVETAAHVEELAGGKKKQEKLGSTVTKLSAIMSSATTKTTCYGRVDIRIAEPFSLLKYIEEASDRQESMMSTDIGRKRLAISAGYRTLFEINQVSVVEPTALVATILLTHSKRGVTHQELAKDAMWLKNLIIARNGVVAPVEHDSISDVVALILTEKKANKLVKKHNNVLMLSLYSPKERIELNIYKNQLIHHFVSDGIMCCSMYACEREKRSEVTDNKILVSHEILLEKTTFLSKLLKLEFIYRPHTAGNKQQANFAHTLALLVRLGIFKCVESSDGSNEMLYVNPDTIDGDNKGTSVYLFICSLFWNFIDSYFLAALAFYYLLPNTIISEDIVISKIQAIGEKLYFEGQLDLYESIAKESIKNAFMLFKTWNVIQFVKIEGQATRGRIMQLKGDYLNNEAKLEELVMQIGKFRKRSRGYSSRRYLGEDKQSDVLDAIALVKQSSST